MIIVGIDPGVTGALALFHHGKLMNIVDMPVNVSRVEGRAVADQFQVWEPDVVYLEWTQPMPKNGSIASYSLGLNSGIVIGVIQALGISLERVRPQAWKSAMGLRGKPKAASRGMATELFPDFADQFRRVKDDGRAEAALIARYGAYQNIQRHNEDWGEHECGRPPDHDGRHRCECLTEGDENEEVASVSDLQGRDRHPAGANTRSGVGASQGVEPWT